MNGDCKMREYSELFDSFYEVEDSVYISNMMQNTFYYSNPKSKKYLKDVIITNNRLYFVWEKSELIRNLYKEWCEREH